MGATAFGAGISLVVSLEAEGFIIVCISVRAGRLQDNANRFDTSEPMVLSIAIKAFHSATSKENVGRVRPEIYSRRNVSERQGLIIR